MKHKRSFLYSLFMAFIFSIGVAVAENKMTDASSIYLSADQTRILKLDRDAAGVIVANPDYANVLVDTPRNLVVTPKRPGTTTFTVIDEQGDVIREERIVIGAVQENYVKIRRACSNASSGSDCVPMSTYYCPDGCHEVQVVPNKR